MNREEKISDILGRMDGKYVDEATMFALDASRETASGDSRPSPKAGKTRRPFRWGAVAACLALVALIGTTIFSVSAEAREYKAAVAFFEENGLSVEGLSRTEVKEVYRDITTESFSYSRTAEVIERAVPGYEIEQAEPTPEQIAALWDRKVWKNTLSGRGISYDMDYEYEYDENRGFDVLARSVLMCYRDGEMIWSAEFPDTYVDDCAYTQDGTAVWGWKDVYSSSDRQYSWVARVDESGTVLWKKTLSHSYQWEQIAAVLDNGDNTWAVISRGDLKDLCLSTYDMDGKELSFHSTEVGNLGIWNAARLGDGYIVQLGNTVDNVNSLLYRMDREGNVTDSFSYAADDCDYTIRDMTEFGGQVWLSGYAVPKQEEEEGGRYEISGILDYIFTRDNWEISSEELTPIVRDNYTAVLLMCDPEGGTPQTFHSVKGSLGGELAVNSAGQLEWDVESITSTFFSPATSSFSVGGTCNVFRYTFDESGTLTGQTDTGETIPYRR